MSDDTDIETEDADQGEAAQQDSYATALEELEDILDEIEGASVDVDTLADRVRRASELVALCRGRLDIVREDVAAVVEDLARQSNPNGTT